MSCITEILKVKGNKEFLLPTPESRLAIEGGGIYKKYEYLIVLNKMGFRCGYVAISPTHPFYDKDLFYAPDEGKNNEDYKLINCHGGVTFFESSHIAEDILGHICKDKWIGFDCGHAFDGYDIENVCKYFPDRREDERWKSAMSDINLTTQLCLETSLKSHEIIVKSFGFVEDECKSIIQQLILAEQKL